MSSLSCFNCKLTHRFQASWFIWFIRPVLMTDLTCLVRVWETLSLQISGWWLSVDLVSPPSKSVYCLMIICMLHNSMASSDSAELNSYETSFLCVFIASDRFTFFFSSCSSSDPAFNFHALVRRGIWGVRTLQDTRAWETGDRNVKGFKNRYESVNGSCCYRSWKFLVRSTSPTYMPLLPF